MDEMKAREAKSDLVCSGGEQLIAAKHPASTDIEARIKSLQQHWKILRELAENRRKQLEDALEAYQVNYVRIFLFCSNKRLFVISYSVFAVLRRRERSRIMVK